MIKHLNHIIPSKSDQGGYIRIKEPPSFNSHDEKLQLLNSFRIGNYFGSNKSFYYLLIISIFTILLNL
jgi:hypothetical protein